MVTVAPASAGLGTTDAETICGTEVSSVTFRVTVDSLPAASVAVTTMVFAPLRKHDRLGERAVRLHGHIAPIDAVERDRDGDGRAGRVVGRAGHGERRRCVISPSAGEVTFSAGGTVSTVKAVLFAAAVLPSLSAASTDTVCAVPQRRRGVGKAVPVGDGRVCDLLPRIRPRRPA